MCAITSMAQPALVLRAFSRSRASRWARSCATAASGNGEAELLLPSISASHSLRHRPTRRRSPRAPACGEAYAREGENQLKPRLRSRDQLAPVGEELIEAAVGERMRKQL